MQQDYRRREREDHSSKDYRRDRLDLRTGSIALLVSRQSSRSLRPPNGSYLSAASAAAEEPAAAVRVQPRHSYSGRHLHILQHISGLGIDSPQLALVTFRAAVPQLAIDPGDTGDEAVRLDGAKNSPCFWIDLMNFPGPILPDPKRPFGPGEA